MQIVANGLSARYERHNEVKTAIPARREFLVATGADHPLSGDDLRPQFVGVVVSTLAGIFV